MSMSPVSYTTAQIDSVKSDFGMYLVPQKEWTANDAAYAAGVLAVIAKMEASTNDNPVEALIQESQK